MTMQAKRGSVVVEWVIVFPTFLFLCLLVIEMSMMWTDRHIVNLAAYEAARTLAIQDVAGKSCDDARAMKSAERAAVFKVAMIAPSPAYFLRGLLEPNQFTSEVSAAERQIDEKFGKTRLGTALKRQVLGIPSAYALTSLTCYEDADGYINVDVRYLRAPKMPFVGGALWATSVFQSIQKFNIGETSSVGDFLQFELDEYYFGAKVRSPAIEKFRNKYQTVKSGIKDSVDGAAGLGVKLTDLASLVRSLPGGSEIGNIFARAGTAATDASRTASDKLNAVSTPIDNTLKSIEKSLNDHSSVLTAMIYQVPASLRLIPMHATVRLKKDFADRRDDEDWTDGKAFLVAPFAVTDEAKSNSPSEDTLDLWTTWAKGLSSSSIDIGSKRGAE